MKAGKQTKWKHSQGRAFALLELLCATAIIAVLGALFLPAVNQGRARAQRLRCVGNLRQVGTGFHVFAHDHNGQLPMAVPGVAGGSAEFVQAAYLAGNEFYFSFRHFQTLSNEVVTPKPLVCPSDTRRIAASFGVLKNDNLSYFVALASDYGQSASVLCGDRNLTNDWRRPATIVRLEPNGAVRWTHELHSFKGNLLFADSHVEERDGARSVTGAGTDLVLPTVPAPPDGSVASPRRP